MKKVLFMVVAAAAFSFASCSSDECCDLSTCDVSLPGLSGEVCEDDLEDSGASWGKEKEGYNMLGCDCY